MKKNNDKMPTKNKEEKVFDNVRIQCDKTIYRKFLETIENTEKMILRFLHI